jgi:hypothetical protein
MVVTGVMIGIGTEMIGIGVTGTDREEVIQAIIVTGMMTGTGIGIMVQTVGIIEVTMMVIVTDLDPQVMVVRGLLDLLVMVRGLLDLLVTRQMLLLAKVE